MNLQIFGLTALIVMTFLTPTLNAQSESGTNIKKLHLNKITYISVDGRFGYGLSQSTLSTENNWQTDGSSAFLMGAGFNYMRKNNYGFDLQINHERGTYKYKNNGPFFSTGFWTLGAELGAKKIILRKAEDTFFVRGGFGINFILNTNDTYSDIYYNYSSNRGATPNMYAFPEVGYQFRFPKSFHLLDISAFYKYSLSSIGTTDMQFTDNGNANESNTAAMSGTYFGFALRYSFMIQAWKKKPEGRSNPDAVF